MLTVFHSQNSLLFQLTWMNYFGEQVSLFFLLPAGWQAWSLPTRVTLLGLPWERSVGWAAHQVEFCSPLLFSLFQSKYNSSVSVSVSTFPFPVCLFNWPAMPCDLWWQLMSNISIPICALFPALLRDCSRQAQFHEKIPLLLLSCIFLSESIFHKPSFLLSMNLIFVTASDAWMHLCCYNPLWQKNI